MRTGSSAQRLAVLLVACGALLLVASAAARSAGAWRAQPAATAASSTLADFIPQWVAADSASDVWVVGSSDSGNVVEHWDGGRWASVPSATAAHVTRFTGVGAISPTDVWVSGLTLTASGNLRALVQHWDGSTWTAVGASRVAGGRGEVQLNGITATASGGVWAVGILCCPRGLIEHWTGSRMSVSPDRALPLIAQSGFDGAAASSPRDAWVVGNSNAPAFRALAEHWSGRRWKAIRAAGAYELSGAAATSPTNAWLVGPRSGSQSTGGGIIEHWNGRRLAAQATAPYPLAAVSASSPSNAWAVGGFASRGVIEHWDGRRWSVQARPPGELQSVAAVSPDDAWAVGERGLLHWNGRTWTTVQLD